MGMEFIVGTVIMPIVLTFFGGLTGWLFARIKKKSEVEEANAKMLEACMSGMKVLMKQSLRKEHDRLMEQGKKSSNEFDEYKEIDEAYTAAGGNHVNGPWLEDVDELPLVG